MTDDIGADDGMTSAASVITGESTGYAVQHRALEIAPPVQQRAHYRIARRNDGGRACATTGALEIARRHNISREKKFFPEGVSTAYKGGER